MRIAILGGADYDEEKFEDFLYKLHAKYPDAIIVTGTAVGKNLYGQDKKLIRAIPSAERAAQSLLSGLGHTIVIPELHGPTLAWMKECKAAGSDQQAGMILNGEWELYRTVDGTIQHRFLTPRADVIVAVGNPDSSRAKYARNHWLLMDSWREKENRRPFVSVAAPPTKKKEKVYKAKKKNDRDLAAA